MTVQHFLNKRLINRAIITHVFPVPAEAEITKLQSEAALNTAKAQGAAQVDPQMKIAEMQNELQMKREELQLRERLAGLTNDQRRLDSETQAASKIAVAAMKTPTGGNNDG